MALYPLNFLIALLFLVKHKTSLIHFSLPYPDSCRWLLAAAALLRRDYLITELLVPPDPYKAGVYFAVTHLLFNPLKKFSYDRARKVIAVSEGCRDILVQKYGMPRGKMTVIHNGIDCSRNEPDPQATERLRIEFGIPQGSVVLANIGRLATQKGQKYLIGALDILAQQGYPLILLLVGDGPLKEQLEEEARSRGVAGLVRFTGFRNDIRAIFAITDIFVMPSLNEGFSLILLEAMAAAKPIVGTRVTGTTEAIVDGETGLLCAPSSPDDLAQKILLLINDRQKRDALGNRAREAAFRKFDVSLMVEKTRGLYEEGMTCAGR